MLEVMEAAPAAANLQTIWADVDLVCKRIPPLWDLHNYVAVNPFLGFTSGPIDEAARTTRDGLGAQVLPTLEYFRQRWREGAFGTDDLAGAAARRRYDHESLKAALSGIVSLPSRTPDPIRTFAERYDRDHGTDWDDRLMRSVARWCAVHVAEGGACWRGNYQDRGLYTTWREAACVDRSLEIAGLRGWRRWVAQLPETSAEAIEAMLQRCEEPRAERVAYLYRLLGGVYGWACSLRRTSWESNSDDFGSLVDLLAIRLCVDAAMVELAPQRATPGAENTSRAVEDESALLVLQEALEDGFVRGLLGKLATPRSSPLGERPAVQAVFCIDVRSEPLRRHLEAQSESIETRGFAGFFGVSLDWTTSDCTSARCPVLLKPSVRLRAASTAINGKLQRAIKRIQFAPAASFSFVEVLGLAYVARLASDAFVAAPTSLPVDGRDLFQLNPNGDGEGLGATERLDLAAGILKNLGLRKSFARLVLLCGHEGHSANNPHAAGLDCGACGGHGGAVNARVAAAVLNHSAVRVGLVARGWHVPDDTHFLPAVHNTSTDEVTLLDVTCVPPGHRSDLAKLRDWLQQAGAQVRSERAASLGLPAKPKSLLGRLLRRRSRDWSETRPEWGLARNAAFIAARRVRTRCVDLQGRAFLHEYDVATDPDNSILNLILSAPMVVASWINLQYFASTVDNRVFGCGSKVTHNRVGSIGVVLGNGGDLRTGLAVQSVHGPDGRWFHEPLRLQVVVEAPPDRIEQVLSVQPAVKELVENGWVRLFALDPDGTGVQRRLPGAGWEAMAAT